MPTIRDIEIWPHRPQFGRSGEVSDSGLGPSLLERLERPVAARDACPQALDVRVAEVGERLAVSPGREFAISPAESLIGHAESLGDRARLGAHPADPGEEPLGHEWLDDGSEHGCGSGALAARTFAATAVEAQFASV